MAQQGPLGGVAFIKVNGRQYQLKGALTVSPGILEATGVAGQDRVHGYTEKPTIPSIEMDISDSGGLSVVELQAVRQATITAELSNGKTYVLRNAWCAGSISVDTEQAQMKVKFEGMSCNELGVRS